jgi:hypothetical protein
VPSDEAEGVERLLIIYSIYHTVFSTSTPAPCLIGCSNTINISTFTVLILFVYNIPSPEQIVPKISCPKAESDYLILKLTSTKNSVIRYNSTAQGTKEVGLFVKKKFLFINYKIMYIHVIQNETVQLYLVHRHNT